MMYYLALEVDFSRRKMYGFVHNIKFMHEKLINSLKIKFYMDEVSL